MSALFELQQNFLAAVISDGESLAESAGGAANGGGYHFDQQGMAVHRNNWRSNLCGALRATYPVVERLVGADFFNYAANCFIDKNPSRSANLEEYGRQFAEFLRAFPPAESLPYLPDVARLEAAIEAVLVAADEWPAVYTLHSLFPVLRIWQINQPHWDGEDTVNLDAGAEYLLIHRVATDVLIEPIDNVRFAALRKKTIDRP